MLTVEMPGALVSGVGVVGVMLNRFTPEAIASDCIERRIVGSSTWSGTCFCSAASSAFSAGRFLAMLRIDCNCSCALWLSCCCCAVCAFVLEMSTGSA